MDDDVMALLQKSISAKLCPTVLGQSCMDIVANPPKPGEPSYDSWLQEKEVRQTKISRQKQLQEPKILFHQGNLASLARRADLVATTLNTIPGFSCNTVQGAMMIIIIIIISLCDYHNNNYNNNDFQVQGAMYAFPQILMPPKAVEAAISAGQFPDVFYAFQLLEATGE